MTAKRVANPGQAVLTEPATEPIRGKVELKPAETESSDSVTFWVLDL